MSSTTAERFPLDAAATEHPKLDGVGRGATLPNCLAASVRTPGCLLGFSFGRVWETLFFRTRKGFPTSSPSLLVAGPAHVSRSERGNEEAIRTAEAVRITAWESGG